MLWLGAYVHECVWSGCDVCMQDAFWSTAVTGPLRTRSLEGLVSISQGYVVNRGRVLARVTLLQQQCKPLQSCSACHLLMSLSTRFIRLWSFPDRSSLDQQQSQCVHKAIGFGLIDPLPGQLDTNSVTVKDSIVKVL